MCEQCARLQAENARLRNQVQRARVVIKRQKAQLDDVRQAAWKIKRRAEDAMTKHLPRGTWALWKGRGEAAMAIFRIVFADFSSMVQDILG
jgi:hypothetical protein